MSVDLAAFVVNADGTVTQELSDRTVSGPARLLQRVAVELLTDRNSIPYSPGRGVPFLGLIRGRAATETDVFAAFAASLPTLRRNLQSEETDADPDEERFYNAKASHILVGRAAFSVRFVIVNKAKRAYLLTVPITVRP